MKSLYFKFVATTLGIMLLSFLIAFLISNMYYQNNLKPENDEKNTHIATEMASFIEENPEVNIEEYMDNIAEIGYQVFLVSESDDGTFYGGEFRETELRDEIINDVVDGEIYHGMRDFPRGTFVTGFFANELENTIGVPLNYQGEDYALFMRPDIKLLFDEMHLLFGVLFAMTIVLSIIFVFIGTNFLVRPVTKLSHATKEVAKGEYHFDNLPVNRNDELGKLSVSFAEMARQIEENRNMQKDFISNISHDIGAPLSNIKGYSSLLYQNDLSQTNRMDYLSIIESETLRISDMTKQLLVLSSLDHESHILKKENYNVSEQITHLLHAYEWKIAEHHLMLSHSLKPLAIYADPSLINMVWDNLLSNAIKYNNEGGTIDVSMHSENSMCVVTVGDTGLGIDEKSIDKVFERFYRVDNTRSNNVKGTGLGLAIVKKIIHLHDGEIYVESNHEGTTFVIKLPFS